MKWQVSHRIRRIIISAMFFIGVVTWLVVNPRSYETELVASRPAASSALPASPTSPFPATSPLAVDDDSVSSASANLATDLLEKLTVKGRAPKTGYARTEFYQRWPDVDGCSLRQRIIRREVGDGATLDGCAVIAGEFTEPYTGEYRRYTTREEFSKNIQIDHIVALSDAWQKGAQYLEKTIRYQIATDPLNLIAVDGPANMQKGDADAATWLPPNKSFRCEYIARQISVKFKYQLWVTEAEKSAMQSVLQACPTQPASL